MSQYKMISNCGKSPTCFILTTNNVIYNLKMMWDGFQLLTSKIAKFTHEFITRGENTNIKEVKRKKKNIILMH